MKKTALALVILVCGLSFEPFAQNIQPIRDLDKRDGLQPMAVTDLGCPSGTIYSQLPDGVNAFSTNNGVYILDNILTDLTNVTTVTWWMMEGFSVIQTFDIMFFEDNDGAPGTPIASFLGVAPSKTLTGESLFSEDVYEYAYSLPTPIDVPAGAWMGIRDYPETGWHYYWLTSSDGDSRALVYANGVYQEEVYDFAFCLDGDEGPSAPQVPLSNWPLVAGLLLTTGFILLRSRQIL